MNAAIVTVDVRDDLRNGREPFSKIMNAAGALQAGQQLLLIAPFEPAPLFRVMEKQGFRHQAHATVTGDWEVLFTREQASSEAEPHGGQTAAQAAPSSGATEIVDVDARGLEPPQPMVKILETIAALPAGAEVRARTDRRPMHLYSHLEERGFSGQTEEQSDGSFITQIKRR